MAQKNYNTANNNFSSLQSEVDQVKSVMTNNIDKILQRGDALDDLVDKTSVLESSAIQFNVNAKKVKRKMWWKNTKMMLILGGVIATILAIIILVLVLKFGGGSSGGGGDVTTTSTMKPITTDSSSKSSLILKALLEN